MTPNTTGPPFLAAVLATLLTPALVVTLPEAWPLGGLLLALAGPAALALVLVAPRHPLGLYLATGAAACAAMTVAGGIGLALRDSAGITWPRLFLENLLWNGAVLLFLGTAGIALGSLPLAARDSPPWRYALPGQLRLLAGIALTALLTVTWLPTTKNQGILVALVATGLAGGLLAGSWWSLPLLPLAVIATAWLWFLLDPPPRPASRSARLGRSSSGRSMRAPSRRAPRSARPPSCWRIVAGLDCRAGHGVNRSATNHDRIGQPGILDPSPTADRRTHLAPPRPHPIGSQR